MHMLRLGFQGVELLSTGTLSLPMREPERSWLYGVRLGEHTLHACLTRAGELEVEIRDLLDASPLPTEPDAGVVERWMLATYARAWATADRA